MTCTKEWPGSVLHIKKTCYKFGTIMYLLNYPSIHSLGTKGDQLIVIQSHWSIGELNFYCWYVILGTFLWARNDSQKQKDITFILIII